MFLDRDIFFKDYLSCSVLNIVANGAYGFQVYFKHSYSDIEFSYFTEKENLIDLINELLDIINSKECDKK